MKDWKGNEIVDGQVCVIVQIYTGKKRIKKNIIDWLGRVRTVPVRRWTPAYDVVFMNQCTLMAPYYPGDTEFARIKWVEVTEKSFRNSVLCIKGISDNEKEYFNSLLKQ